MLIWILAAVVWSRRRARVGLFEAQWVEYVERRRPRAGLPPELDGLRILHLSDFHLGTLSLNGAGAEKAVAWASRSELDLVAVTGDLVSAAQRGDAVARASAGAAAAAPRRRTPCSGTTTSPPRATPSVAAADLERGRGRAQLLERRVRARSTSRASVSRSPAATRARAAGARTGRSPIPDADLRILLCTSPTSMRMAPAWVSSSSSPATSTAARSASRPRAGRSGSSICVPLLGGRLRAAGGRRSSRLARPGDELRPVPLPRPARGELRPATLRTRRVDSRSGMAYQPLVRLDRGRRSTHAPPPCVDCVFWQSPRGGRRRRSAGPSGSRRTGAPGARSTSADGDRLARLRPVRAGSPLPAGERAARRARRRHDAVLVTCAYLVDLSAPVGAAEPLPRGHRRGARPGHQGDRDLRLPLSGGRERLRALPRPPDGLPVRLPRRLRLRRRRWEGDVALARLELGGLQPVEDGSRRGRSAG